MGEKIRRRLMEKGLEAADRLETKQDLLDRMTHSLSFGLLMTCLGLCVVLTVVICHVF